MIRVYKSDTGQYVLVNEPTETVIIDDNLEAAFNKMQEFVRENHPELLKKLFEPFDAHKAKPTVASAFSPRPGMIALIASLPFLWLVLLHFTISSIADDVVDFVRRTSGPSAAEFKQVQGDLLRLNEQVSRLGADKQGAAVGPDQIRAETKPLAEAQATAKTEIERLRGDVTNLIAGVANLNTQVDAIKKAAQPAPPAAPAAPK